MPLSFTVPAANTTLSGAWLQPHPTTQATKLNLSLDERGAPRTP